MIASRTYVGRSIERLYGIIEGINIDCHINDQEVIALKNWLDIHETLHDVEPFKGLTCLVSEILEDGVIDPDEREDLEEWCSETINEHGFFDCITRTVRQLHGVMSGIICDGKIKAEELEGLRDWLLDYEHMQDWWPFNELKRHIDIILADGKVDQEEQRLLRDFFSNFTEHVVSNPKIHDDEYWMNRNLMTLSPVFNSISCICEDNPDILFKEKRFCFTGPAASGKRKYLAAAVEQLGGFSHNKAVIELDYLVIGAQASPAWIYSTYGRKIEAVMQRKEKKPHCQTQIIREYDFLSAVSEKGIDLLNQKTKISTKHKG